jgi:hypothetical protein
MLLLEFALKLLELRQLRLPHHELAEAAGLGVAGITGAFAGGFAASFSSSLGASTICPSASSTMKHSRVGS